MGYLWSLLLNGLSAGCIYALIALGFAIVYGVLRLLNFAHSEVFATGTFIAYFVMVALAGIQIAPIALVGLAILAASLGAGVLSVVIERVAYRPLRGVSPVMALLSAIGVSILLQAVGRELLGAQTRGFPVVDLPIGPKWFAVATLLTVFVAIMIFIHRSTLGLQIRAVSERPQTAVLMGIDTNRAIVSAFFISGLLAGVGGVVWGIVYGTVSPQMGFVPALKSFMIAALGSIGRLDGTFTMGVALGVFESLVSGYLPPEYSELREPIIFLLLIVLLVGRPAGLLGEQKIVKV